MRPRSTYPDPLLNALTVLGKIHGRPVNREAATAGLPLDEGWLTPQTFGRAASRCGFKASVIKCRLSELDANSLPAILLTDDGFTYILTKRVGKRDGEIIHPETGGAEVKSIKEIAENYSGYSILIKPAYEVEGRSEFGKDKGKRNSSWLWGTLWKFRSFYARVAIVTLFINFLALASSLFVMNVYDRVVPNQATETLFVLAIGALVAYTFEFILKSLRTFFVDRAGHRADIEMGSRLFEKILGMSYASKPASAGALASQARAYEHLREFFTSATVAAMVDLPFVFVFAGIIYLLGGVVAVPMVVGALLALTIGALVQIPLKRSVEASYQASNQRHALFVESINALETVKATRAESALQSRMERCVEISSKAEGKARWFSQTALNATAFIQHLVSMAIIILAFYQITNEKMSMGAMIACVILAGRGMAPMAMVASLLSRLQQSWRSYKGIDEIMKAPGERVDAAERISLRSFEPSVQLSKVDFSYPEAEDTPALNKVSLNIKAGERVAILGRIGSGKSTTLRLITGLYQPAAGRVDISGIDTRQVDPAELRKNIGYVGQDPTLFYGTLRMNITIGSPWREEDEVLDAVTRAGLLEFVKSNPKGLDLMVSEGGTSLSGGQRQAVCLARAILEQPSLLIFDEPTSAMDAQSERGFVDNVRRYLNEESDERTLIVATHKQSLLELVDRVIVMDRGQVVADGPKEQVIRSLPRKPGEKMKSKEPVPPKEPISRKTNNAKPTRRVALAS